jgi:hypothetical protein
LQARSEQQRKLERQRSRHLRLAVDLAADEHFGARMIAKADERVELWRSRRCWSAILALPPRKVAKAMASLGEWENAMFQNSPWESRFRQTDFFDAVERDNAVHALGEDRVRLSASALPLG